MLFNSYHFDFKFLSSLRLTAKTALTLALVSSFSYPVLGMDDDQTAQKGGITPIQKTGFSTTASDNQDQQTTTSSSASVISTIQPPNFAELPEDIYQNIFALIGDVSDFVRFTWVCKPFYNLLNDVIQNKVVILGPTGSGKSTLLHLFMGKPLVAEKTTWWGPHLAATEKVPNVNIGHSASAGTLQPNSIVDFSSKRLVIDFPGFHDPRGKEQDFINANALHKHLKGKLSVVFVMPEAELEGSNGQRFACFINKLTEIFPNQAQLQNVLSFVVSKQGDRSPTQYSSVVHLNHYIENRPAYLTERGYQLLQFLVANQGHFVDFKRPFEEGSYSVSEDLKKFMQNREYVENPQVSIPLKESVTSSDNQQRWSSKNSYNSDGTQGSN